MTIIRPTRLLDGRGSIAVLCATLPAASALLLFLPSIVYFFNSSFVEYTILEHYAVALPVALLVGFALFAIGLIPRAPRGLLIGACRFIVTYIVIAAVFFPSWTPALDGREHFADNLSRASIQSHLLLGVLATGVIILLLRRPASARVLGHAMFVTAMVFVAYVAISDTKPAGSHTGELLKEDIQRLLTFSSQRNILIVLMDQFQGDVFAELLEEDRALFQGFDGFSYFPNITGVAPQTHLAMPAIYSARLYQGGSIRELYADSYRDSVFLDAQRAGYSTALYGHHALGCPAPTCVDQPLLLKGLAESILASYLGLMDYGLMRISPTSLHPSIFRRGVGMLKQLTPSHYTVDSLRGLEIFAARARVGEVPPTFKFLHLLNTHPPININEGCRLDEKRRQTRENYKIQARCGIKVFLDVLGFLERSSLYDRSLVMLLSDHGATLTAPSRPYALDGAVKLQGGRVGQFLPLLLVKPPGSRGLLKISQAPASLIDVRATICEAAEICDPPTVGVSVLSLAEGVTRERTFIDYRLFWRDLLGRDEVSAVDLQRFVTSVSVRDLATATDVEGRAMMDKAPSPGASAR